MAGEQRYPEVYGTMGLRDLADQMFATLKETRQTHWLAEAFSTLPTLAMTPAAAYQHLVRDEIEHVPLENLANRVLATSLVPYPPGIPMLMPGEMTGPADGPYLGYLRALWKWDSRFPGFGHDTHGDRDQGRRVVCPVPEAGVQGQGQGQGRDAAAEGSSAEEGGPAPALVLWDFFTLQSGDATVNTCRAPDRSSGSSSSAIAKTSAARSSTRSFPQEKIPYLGSERATTSSSIEEVTAHDRDRQAEGREAVEVAAQARDGTATSSGAAAISPRTKWSRPSRWERRITPGTSSGFRCPTSPGRSAAVTRSGSAPAAARAGQPICFLAGIHGREWGGPDILVYFGCGCSGPTATQEADQAGWQDLHRGAGACAGGEPGDHPLPAGESRRPPLQHGAAPDVAEEPAAGAEGPKPQESSG